MKYIVLIVAVLGLMFLSACAPYEAGIVDQSEVSVIGMRPVRYEDDEYKVVCYTNSSGLFCFTFEELGIRSSSGK